MEQTELVLDIVGSKLPLLRAPMVNDLVPGEAMAAIPQALPVLHGPEIWNTVKRLLFAEHITSSCSTCEYVVCDMILALMYIPKVQANNTGQYQKGVSNTGYNNYNNFMESIYTKNELANYCSDNVPCKQLNQLMYTTTDQGIVQNGNI